VTAPARVFLIPFAGCGAGLFRRWPASWNGVELLAVELPGRETRFGEQIAGSFEELADAAVAGLAPWLDVPYAFFGHCWSALAAYEMTVRAAAADRAPRHLFVSSQVAPQDGPVGRMLGMSDAEMADEIAVTMRALGGVPHPQLVALYVDVLAADVDASRRYVVPDPVRVGCPITAIGWTADAEVPPGRMGGWPRCGATESVTLAGGHHRFVDAPPELLDVLSGRLLAT
jgi:surfactin synthase thioesterase subunit